MKFCNGIDTPQPSISRGLSINVVATGSGSDGGIGGLGRSGMACGVNLRRPFSTFNICPPLQRPPVGIFSPIWGLAAVVFWLEMELAVVYTGLAAAVYPGVEGAFIGDSPGGESGVPFSIGLHRYIPSVVLHFRHHAGVKLRQVNVVAILRRRRCHCRRHRCRPHQWLNGSCWRRLRL